MCAFAHSRSLISGRFRHVLPVAATFGSAEIAVTSATTKRSISAPASFRSTGISTDMSITSMTTERSIYNPARSTGQRYYPHATTQIAHGTSTSKSSHPHNSNILPHDVGGDIDSFGSLSSNIERPDELFDWEVKCHALFAVLATKGVLTTDGLRRSIESLTPNQYSSWTYYEKWAAGMCSLLLETGTISTEELSEALFGHWPLASESRTSSTPIFKENDSVRVRSFRQNGSDIEWRRPHIRVPGYIYGCCGVIERVAGEHKDPSFLAFGLEAPKARLYRVRFLMKDIWPEHRDSNSTDVIEAEVYEPWLEASDEPTGHDFEDSKLFDHSHNGSDCVHAVTHSLHHDNHHDHGDHSHDPRPDLEERAAALEGEPRPGKELYSALIKILVQKDLVSHEEIRAMAERLVMAGSKLNGASLVVRAWMDPDFEERLLLDAQAAAAELGITTSNPNAPTELTVVKNTNNIHNIVVCTLCSCYPSALLGIAPSWYKSREYRSRAVREPRKVLKEFGTEIPNTCQIRVHDSTADHRYLVLPQRPDGTEGMSFDELRSLVTRDSLVGVSLPCLPTS